jgi:hypothetical protein
MPSVFRSVQKIPPSERAQGCSPLVQFGTHSASGMGVPQGVVGGDSSTKPNKRHCWPVAQGQLQPPQLSSSSRLVPCIMIEPSGTCVGQRYFSPTSGRHWPWSHCAQVPHVSPHAPQLLLSPTKRLAKAVPPSNRGQRSMPFEHQASGATSVLQVPPKPVQTSPESSAPASQQTGGPESGRLASGIPASRPPSPGGPESFPASAAALPASSPPSRPPSGAPPGMHEQAARRAIETARAQKLRAGGRLRVK